MQIIRDNPTAFMDALTDAVNTARAAREQQESLDQADSLSESMGKSWTELVRSDDVVMGTANAPYILMMYSDFECPYCHRGYNTVKALMEKYPGQIALVYRHVPLDFHDHTLPAARYFEALRLQNPAWAAAFFEDVFGHFERLQKGDSFFAEIAKTLGADIDRLALDLASEAVAQRIEDDQAEAKALGFSGTPGFLLNGVPIEGAVLVARFEQIMALVKAKGRLNPAAGA